MIQKKKKKTGLVDFAYMLKMGHFNLLLSGC